MFRKLPLLYKEMLRYVLRMVLIAAIVLLVMLALQPRHSSPTVVRGNMAFAEDSSVTPEGIDSFIVENLQRTGLPGVALAVTKGDTVLYTAGYGHDSSGKPITPDTAMPIGSISKSFTAFAVMQLVEQGKVNLDTPVNIYLPEFALADPLGAEITVRQVLTQTSGMSDTGFPEMDLPQPDSLQGAVARLREAKLIAEPGTQFIYHNPNYQVAARLVEVVSGEPFADYLQQHIFEPLGMNSSQTFDRAEQTISRTANGYVFIYGRPVARSILPHFFNGAGGVVSTAHDLAHWLILQNSAGNAAEDEQLITPQSLNIMHTPSNIDGDYAMGWEQDILADGTKRLEHGGTPFTFSADQAIFPETRYGFTLLFNNTSTFGAEQISFIEGLTSLVQGNQPKFGVRVSFIADSIVAFLTLLAVVNSVDQLKRARTWVTTTPLWRMATSFLLSLIPIIIFVNLPTVAGFVFGNRDVTWKSALYGWLALVIWLAAVALINSLVLAIRSYHLVKKH